MGDVSGMDGIHYPCDWAKCMLTLWLGYVIGLGLFYSLVSHNKA